MKRILTYAMLLSPLFAWAQTTQGTVQYDEKINLHLRLSEEDEHIRSMMPEFQTTVKLLHFTADASNYRNRPDDDGEQTVEGGEGDVQIRMVFKRPDEELFKNLAEGQQIEQRELFGKRFLIKGELEAYNWKLTGEQKEILGYNCQQALIKDTAKTVEAWFAPEIPVATGPGSYGQLPGLILAVDINDGERSMMATEIKLEAPDMSLLKAPSKGKAVTADEFHEIMAKKQKEMEEEGGGRRMIIRRH